MANFDVTVYDILTGVIKMSFSANTGAEAINVLRAYTDTLSPETVIPIDLKAIIKNNILNRQINMSFVPGNNNKLHLQLEQEN